MYRELWSQCCFSQKLSPIGMLLFCLMGFYETYWDLLEFSWDLNWDLNGIEPTNMERDGL